MENAKKVSEESQLPAQPAPEKLPEAKSYQIRVKNPLIAGEGERGRGGEGRGEKLAIKFKKGFLDPDLVSDGAKKGWLKKLRGGLLLAIGYLLSPLCWWNDLFFNLPIAYAFGYICSWLSPDLLFPCSIVGYWLSNIAGILLMQFGAVDVFTDKPKENNLKKELLTGLVSSTAFTVVVVALIHFNVLDTPDLFSGKESINLSSVLPMMLVTLR